MPEGIFYCLFFSLWWNMSAQPPRVLEGGQTGSWILSFPPLMSKARFHSTCCQWASFTNIHSMVRCLLCSFHQWCELKAGKSDAFGSWSRRGWDCKTVNIEGGQMAWETIRAVPGSEALSESGSPLQPAHSQACWDHLPAGVLQLSQSFPEQPATLWISAFNIVLMSGYSGTLF